MLRPYTRKTRPARCLICLAVAANLITICRMHSVRTSTFVIKAILFLLTCLAGYALIVALVGTFQMPIMHDVGTMHFIASRILDGDVPYRDLYDINLPGTYLIHMLCISVFGRSSAGWRLFDLFWLAGTTALLVQFVRPAGKVASGSITILFGLYYSIQNPLYLGQRDFYLSTLLVLSACLLFAAQEHPKWRAGILAASGGSVVFAMMIKPYAALFGLILLMMLVGSRGLGRSAWRGLLYFASGGMVVGALILIWLIAVGGLEAFLETAMNVPAKYGDVDNKPLLVLIATLVFALGSFLWLSAGVLLLPLIRHLSPTLRPHYFMALLGMGYGVVHALIQQKAYIYHYFPFFVFASLLMAMAIGDLCLRRKHYASVVALLAYAIIVLPAAFYALLHEPVTDLAAYQPIMPPLIADLESFKLQPGETIQAQDVMTALYRLDLQQATRFIYDSTLFYNPEHPVTQHYRHEFLAAIEAHPPRLILFLDRAYPGLSLDRLNTFPEYQALLHADYHEAIRREGSYTIYERNE